MTKKIAVTAFLVGLAAIGISCSPSSPGGLSEGGGKNGVIVVYTKTDFKGSGVTSFFAHKGGNATYRITGNALIVSVPAGGTIREGEAKEETNRPTQNIFPLSEVLRVQVRHE